MDRMRGSAEIVSWSPNRMVIETDVFEEDRLVVNQNFASGWKVSGAASGAEPSDQGLLSAVVTPDTKLVTFRYRPVSVIVGTLVSLATLLGCLVFAWRRCRAGKGVA